MPTLQLTTLELPFSPSNFVYSRCFLLALAACLVVLTLHRFFIFTTSRKYSLPTVSTVATSDKLPSQPLIVEATRSSVVESKGAANTPSTSSPSSSAKPDSSVHKKSKWTWGWFTWESLPVSLPVSLKATETHNRVIGQGVGVSSRPAVRGAVPPPPPPQGSQMHKQPQMQSVRRGAPVFDRPLPAIYQTQVPASMAKMIMSRHTFRRPHGSRPPPPSNSSVPAHPSSRRNCSTMV